MLCSTTVSAPTMVSSNTYECDRTAFGPMVQRCPMTLAVTIAPGETVVCEPMRVLELTLHVLPHGGAVQWEMEVAYASGAYRDRLTVPSLAMYLFPRRYS